MAQDSRISFNRDDMRRFFNQTKNMHHYDTSTATYTGTRQQRIEAIDQLLHILDTYETQTDVDLLQGFLNSMETYKAAFEVCQDAPRRPLCRNAIAADVERLKTVVCDRMEQLDNMPGNSLRQ